MKGIISSLLILMSLTTFAQNALDEGYSAHQKQVNADVIGRLEPEFQRSPSRDRALELAESFYYLKKYKKAISYFEYALDKGQLNEGQTKSYYYSLFEFGDLRTAKEVAQDYRVKFGKMDLQAKMENYEELKKANTSFLEMLPTMNSRDNEYGMYPLFADYKMLNTDRDIYADPNDENYDENANRPMSPHMMSILDIEKDKPNLTPMFENAKGEKFVTLVTHYDANTTTIYITRFPHAKKSIHFDNSGKSTMKLYLAKIDQFFKLGQLVPFKYNSDQYSVGHASVSKDGNTLYFSSDMPGGFGGTDLYRCQKLEDGSWGAPINLGALVNSSGDELFPFITAKNDAIFFSSTGHSVFGGLDIVKCTKTRYNAFGKPMNIGLPFNSNKDDFAFVFTDDKCKKGFFSSNRIDGMGGIDIYQFESEIPDAPEPEKKKPEAKPRFSIGGHGDGHGAPASNAPTKTEDDNHGEIDFVNKKSDINK